MDSLGKNISGIEKLKSKLKYIYLTTLIVAMKAYPVYASGNNKYAQNISNWVMDGVKVITLVAAVAMMGLCLIHRKLTKLFVTFVLSAIIVAIVYNPDLLKNAGDYLARVIFG